MILGVGMKKKTSLTLDEALVDLVKASAEKENRSMSQEVEKVLRDHYERLVVK